MQTLPSIKHIAIINAPIGKVYETLATGKGWDGWFTDGAIVDLETKRIQLVWTMNGPYKANGTETGPIVSAIPDKEFSFIWHEGKHNTTVTFTLEPKDNKTQITVIETGYLLTDEGMWQLLDCAIGWGEAITLMKFYLEHGIRYDSGW
jgi:uncharacterized protein YndB with AHSA1/START domain